MSEVKRYTFKGAAGEYVYSKEFDRVTAERDAALVDRDYCKRIAEHNKEIGEQLQQRLTAADDRADVLSAKLAELCDHEWTDDGEWNVICTKCDRMENHEPHGWVQTRGSAINHFTQEWDVVQEWEDKGFEYKAMYDRPELSCENNPEAADEHVCAGCGSKGWTANCGECVPY